MFGGVLRQGMFVAPPPEGHEDWSQLTGRQVAAAQLAAV